MRRRKSRSLRAERQTSSASVSEARPSPSAIRTSTARASASSGSFLALDRLGMREQFFDRGRIERMKHQHAGARQERRVELEGWIFGGGADHHHRAASSITGRKEILLCAVEAMHLVDEQQRALAHLAAGTRGVECLLQIGDAGEHRGDLLEMQIGGVRQQPRHRGLAGPGRPQNTSEPSVRVSSIRVSAPSGPRM